MTYNPRKQQFLNDQYQPYLAQDQSFEQIQMVNMKSLNNQGAQYIKFQDQGQHNYNPYNKINSNSTPQKTYADKPIVPSASYNFQPNKIVMNGLTFVHKDAIRGAAKTGQKAKKPQMQVVCEKCYAVQIVPGNTHSFICFKCDLTQGCQPQYGIFVCGSCQRKVWYLHGTSQFIKCTKCGTINHIPVGSFPDGKNDIRPKEQEMSQKYFTQRHPQMYP